MKVYLNAFHCDDICPDYSLAKFAGDLSATSEFKFGGVSRALGTAVQGDFLVGLLLSATNITKDPLLTHDSKGNIVVKVHDTSANGARQATNFFVINCKTGTGLLSRYFGAGTVSSFGNVIRYVYKIAKRKHRDSLIIGYQKARTPFDENDVLVKFKAGDLAFTPIYRDGTFETLLQSLAVITELTFDEPTVNEPKYRLVKDQLSLDRRVLRFAVTRKKKDTPPRNRKRDAVVQFIRDTIINRDVKTATAKGKSDSGKDMPPVTISPEVDSFGEYLYNNVVIDANMKIAAISSAPMISDMLAIAHANARIFATRIVKK